MYHWLASYLAIVIFGADECRDNARINQSFLELPVTFTMRWGGQQTKCMYAAGTAHVPELFIKSKERSLLVDGALILSAVILELQGVRAQVLEGRSPSELANIAGATQYVHSIRNLIHCGALHLPLRVVIVKMLVLASSFSRCRLSFRLT